jgi:hypothetical protein
MKFGLSQKENPIIAAWMHGDEPDNAQSLASGKGYGPPILPEVILRDYERLRAADKSRPVFLKPRPGSRVGQLHRSRVRRNHPEDYAEYIKGGDIVSFDIYPVVHESPEIRGKLEYVARGVQRLRNWSRDQKIVWNCIECTHISNPKAKATPEQVCRGLVVAHPWLTRSGLLRAPIQAGLSGGRIAERLANARGDDFD